MIYTTATPAMPASTGAHSSEFRWGQAVYAASVAYHQPAYEGTTPDTQAILQADNDGRQDRLSFRFEQPGQWETADAQRFRQLAVKHATGAISAEEKTEMDRLVLARRRLLTPMTIDQMRFECHRRQAVQAVLNAFDEYFKLVSPAHRPEA